MSIEEMKYSHKIFSNEGSSFPVNVDPWNECPISCYSWLKHAISSYTPRYYKVQARDEKQIGDLRGEGEAESSLTE